MGLRERKKLRTRRTIERTALQLFAKHGFHATTLAQIAEAAEVAPSTLHAYFPSKEDILFATLDAARESARRRLQGRSENERVVTALQAWLLEDLPEITGGEVTQVQQRRAIIDSDDAVLAQERLRLALLEDVLAEAFARDLNESSDDLRARLMASVAVNGLRAIWLWWYRHQENGVGDPREVYDLDATYLTSLLEAAEHALEQIPSPDEHFRQREAEAGTG
jgi:AcrR family transcriptional regulator